MYYRGFYRGAPFCRFGFGSLFLLGGAFILGSIVSGNCPPWSRRFHHWGCQCPDCVRRTFEFRNHHHMGCQCPECSLRLKHGNYHETNDYPQEIDNRFDRYGNDHNQPRNQSSSNSGNNGPM